MIKVKNLVKQFGSTTAVDDVSFDVSKGEVVGFLGPNGAGKTTTMRILTCFLPADQGTAEIAGFDVFHNSLEVRSRVGYLPESAPLYYDMTPTDFLTFIARMRKIPANQIPDRIRKMIEVCGLQKELKKQIGTLSRGYRQRIGLAQSLIHDPDILILDEPTSGLDPTQIIEIRELIKEIGKEKTVILSTHILPEATATCGRILIINEGKLVADGTPEELTASASGEGASFYVTVKGPSTEVKQTFKNMDGVSYFKVLTAPDNDSVRLLLKATGGSQAAENIFKTAVDKNWVLTELHKESISLEDVFLQLTMKEKQA